MADTKPPLELDVEVETADGTLYRLDATSRRASKRPQSISHSTQRGEGCGPGSFKLTRETMRDYEDLGLIDTHRFVGKDGSVAYEGLNHDFGRTNDPVQQFLVTLVGWYAATRFRKFSEIYVDRSLANWGGPSTARRAQVIPAGYRFVAEPDINGWRGAGATAPGIVFTFNHFEASYIELQEAWYWGGGVDIGELRFDVATLSGGSPDTNWAECGFLSPDDVTSSVVASTPSHQEAVANLAAVANGAGYKYALLQDAYLGPSIGDYNIAHGALNPRIFGRHGLTKQGPAGEEGFFASDMLADIINRFTPLTWAGNPTSYPIGQANFKGVKPDDAIKTLNDFDLLETAVYEEKKFLYYPADLTKADWIVRTDDPGVRFTPLQGDSIESFANGVEVTFTDFSGRTQTLYPSDFAELRDEAEGNPANRHGVDLWAEYTAPFPCNLGEALQIGRAYLAEYNRPKAPGTISIAGGYIRDAEGHWHQGWKPRSSETIALVNHPNDAPRLITQTNWDQDGKTLQISVDNGYQLLSAYMARAANGREAANLP